MPHVTYYPLRAGSRGNTSGGWCKLGLAIWYEWPRAGPLSIRFSGKMSSSLTENIYIAFVAHILTFKGRDSFYCESFNYSERVPFVLPSLHLNYVLVYVLGC